MVDLLPHGVYHRTCGLHKLGFLNIFETSDSISATFYERSLEIISLVAISMGDSSGASFLEQNNSSLTRISKSWVLNCCSRWARRDQS